MYAKKSIGDTKETRRIIDFLLSTFYFLLV